MGGRREEVAVASQVQPRHHTPGGWRRVLFGLLVGVGFGALVTRVVPPDRSWPPGLADRRGRRP